MTPQHAEARVHALPEPAARVRPGVHEQAHSTSLAVASGDGAAVREAMDAFTWERRGTFGRLVRRPRA
jgi:hypothetical protein